MVMRKSLRTNVTVDPGTANAGVVDEVENPNPAKNTNNWYKEDGYGGGSYGSASFGGGSYTDCADMTQPGVAPIVNYLKSLHRPIAPNCQAGHYYLLNNYNPGYFGNGNNAYTDTNADNTVFTVPPSAVPSIGDEMLAAHLSWKYYGDQWDNYVPDPYQLNYGAIGAKTDEYCTICNPFQYDTSIMANATIRNAHIQDTANLYSDIANGMLPAVSFVKPSGLVDGHPASSKLDLFEGFTKRSWMRCRPIPSCGRTRPSSSPSTKAAAITIPVTCSLSISSATARAFRSSWSRRIRRGDTSCTNTPTMSPS